MRRNYRLFGSKTTSNSGAPKKDLKGNGTLQNPAMKKDSQPIPTFYRHLYQTLNKKNKQCSLEDKQKSRQAEKKLKDKCGKIIKAVIAQKSDRRYFA